MRWHEDPAVIPWRYILIVLMFAAGGFWFALLLVDSTYPGLDLNTYQRAGRFLVDTGNPYGGNPGAGIEVQYRYPPLLAMLMPVFGWAPVWYTVLGLATLVPLYVGRRERGAAGLLIPMFFTGLWAQQLINGNVQAIVIALLVAVPFYRRAGAVALAVATMLKLHPALGALWYFAKRDWVALKWFIGACISLLIVQAPWLPRFIDYYLNHPESRDVPAGASLLALGVIPWITGTVVVAAIAYVRSRRADGWGWIALLQLVALPRVLAVNIALLLSAPHRVLFDPASISRPGKLLSRDEWESLDASGAARNIYSPPER